MTTYNFLLWLELLFFCFSYSLQTCGLLWRSDFWLVSSLVHAFYPNRDISLTIGWTALKFGTDIYIPSRMKFNDIVDYLPFLKKWPCKNTKMIKHGYLFKVWHVCPSRGAVACLMRTTWWLCRRKWSKWSWGSWRRCALSERCRTPSLS